MEIFFIGGIDLIEDVELFGVEHEYTHLVIPNDGQTDPDMGSNSKI